MFALQDNIDLQGSVHLLINHFRDTIIQKNIETMKDVGRVGSFKVHFPSIKNKLFSAYSKQFKKQILKSKNCFLFHRFQGLNFSLVKI